ncbi:MAG: VWA domain-containing protein [bacterium]|nr:VWA domain-containing protein [bacterium]
MTFTTPAAFILLLLLLPVIYIGWPRLRYRRARDISSLLLRVMILLLLVFSLAGTQVVRSADRLAVVFLVDVSDSMGAAAQEAALDTIRAVLPDMGVDDVAGIVAFGGDAQVERALSGVRELGTLRAAPNTGNTDLAEAIRLGLALFPDDAARRMVILSDGQPTVGDTEAAANLAVAAGVEISYIPFQREPTLEVQVEELRVPTVLSEGQQFDLTVTITSEVDTPARVSVLAAGQIVHQEEMQLRAGTNNYSLTLVAGQAGFRDFLVDVQPIEGDGFYQNNRMGAFTRVEGDPRVLVVSADDEESRYIVPALTESGLAVDQLRPNQLPVGVAPLAQYDTVVLVNVSAADLSVGRMETLESYVSDLGGGLVVVGGPDSYGPGGYFQTPLEDALPVTMQLEDQQRIPQLTIAYVIDTSGSMGAVSPRGIAYVDLAKDAVIRSIGFLQSSDRAAVVSFDFNAYYIAEFQDVVNGSELQRLVATLRPDGGTSIRAGMQLIARDIVNEPSEIKHIILLTDGGADPAGLVETSRQLFEEDNVTTSVIAIGDDSAAPFLGEMARLGGGNYHNVLDIDNIPTIFAQETVLATRSYIIEQEPFAPSAVAISANSVHPILQGIGAVPRLRGYVATTARPAAQVLMRGPEPYRDPILAAWQYGLGRSVAFTSDATSRWGAEWVTWADYTRFWSQAVRWTMTEGVNSNLETRVVMENEQARIIVDARDEDGGFLNGLSLETRVVYDPEQPAQRIQLRQVAPGRYEGVFTPDEEGAYFLRTTDPTQEGINQTTGWVMTYSPEYEVRQTDDTLLAQIAEMTGGQNLAATPEGIFARNLRYVQASLPIWPWLLLAAMLLLPFDVAVRRLIVTQSDLRRLRAYLNERVLGRQLAAEGPARLSALREARERARDTIRDRSSSVSAPAAPSTPHPLTQAPPSEPTTSTAPSQPSAPSGGGLSALKERRQQARTTSADAAPIKPPVAPPTAPPAAPPPPAPKAPAPSGSPATPTQGKSDSDQNIGARLLKRKRGTDEDGA